MDSSEGRSNGGYSSVQLSIRIAPEAREAIERIQRLGRMDTIGEALRRAISDELFLQERVAQGWRILLEKDKVIQELVWAKSE